jgi:hypothetical protein
VCCADLKATISSDFNQTWTILNDIKNTLTTSLNLTGVYTTLADLKATVSTDFQQTWTILNSIAGSLCCNTSSCIVTGTVITAPGTYCLATDVLGTITIAANDVILNLNGKVLTAQIYGINATNQTNIVVKNGVIQNATASGILVSTCTSVSMQDILFRGAFTNAIQIDNSSCLDLSNIYGCNIVFNDNAFIRCANSQNVSMNNCGISGSSFTISFTTFSFFNCIDIKMFNIQDLQTATPGLAGQFYSSLLFESCTNVFIDTAKILSTVFNNGASINRLYVVPIFSLNSAVLSIRNSLIENSSYGAGNGGLVSPVCLLGSSDIILDGIRVADNNSINVNGLLANNHQFIPFFLDRSSSFFLSQCETVRNSSQRSVGQRDFLISSGGTNNSGVLKMCSSNSNFKSGTAITTPNSQFGFDISATGSEIILDSCAVQQNDFSLVPLDQNAFRLTGTGFIVRNCFAARNSGSRAMIGFLIQGQNLTLDDCFSVENVSTSTFSTAYGFSFIESSSCVVQNSLAKNNRGATSIGFNIQNNTIAFTNAFLGNRSVGHGAVNNFVTTSPILQVQYDLVPIFASRAATLIDNVSVV